MRITVHFFGRHRDTNDEAWNQLQTAIDWGHYAELFAYDYNSGEFYLEEAKEG